MRVRHLATTMAAIFTQLPPRDSRRVAEFLTKPSTGPAGSALNASDLVRGERASHSDGHR